MMMHGGDFSVGAASLIVGHLHDEWTMGREAQPPILIDEQVKRMLGHLEEAGASLALLKEHWPKAEQALLKALEVLMEAKDGRRAAGINAAAG